MPGADVTNKVPPIDESVLGHCKLPAGFSKGKLLKCKVTNNIKHGSMWAQMLRKVVLTSPPNLLTHILPLRQLGSSSGKPLSFHALSVAWESSPVVGSMKGAVIQCRSGGCADAACGLSTSNEPSHTTRRLIGLNVADRWPWTSSMFHCIVDVSTVPNTHWSPPGALPRWYFGLCRKSDSLTCAMTSSPQRVAGLFIKINVWSKLHAGTGRHVKCFLRPSALMGFMPTYIV